MAEDKALWREALAHYHAWNDAEFADCVQRAGEQTLAEKWRAYLDLMTLCWRINPEPSEWEQRQTVKEWETYYARMQRFEEQRSRRGAAT